MAILNTLTLSQPTFLGLGIDGAVAALRRAIRAAESRRQLAQLDDRMLADIGLGRAEAVAEAERAPWDLSPRRR